MQQSPRMAFTVRSYNSAATIEAALRSIRSQSVPCTIVVVDSGSSDGTVAIASGYADRVLRLPHAEFTYGRALNLGAEATDVAVQGTLSSHSVLPRPDWVEIAAEHIERGAAGACGIAQDAAGGPLAEAFRADHAYLLEHRSWGFTNHASAWSRDVWDRNRFDEDLIASEDKEWAWRATEHDGYIVADPKLLVPGTHRRKTGSRAYFRRVLLEVGSLHQQWPLEPYPLSEAIRDMARSSPRTRGLTGSRPFGRTRLIEVAARWTAGRRTPG